LATYPGLAPLCADLVAALESAIYVVVGTTLVPCFVCVLEVWHMPYYINRRNRFGRPARDTESENERTKTSLDNRRLSVGFFYAVCQVHSFKLYHI